MLSDSFSVTTNLELRDHLASVIDEGSSAVLSLEKINLETSCGLGALIDRNIQYHSNSKADGWLELNIPLLKSRP